MTCPIVFIHRGNSSYLPYTLAQARLLNPQSPVVLLGDSSNRYEQVQHEPLSDYFELAADFAKVYHHLSTNPIDYELFCLQRWFVLAAWMQQHRVEHCLYLDSDVMLYSDASSEFQRFATFELTLSGQSPHCTFVSSLTGLQRFCQFVTDLYQPDSLAELEAQFQAQLRQSICAAISDMTAFNRYRAQYPERLGELQTIVEGATYDLYMNVDQGFELAAGMKQIHWVDGRPYGTLMASGQAVRFHILHFQGATKHRIQEFFTGTTPLQRQLSQAELTAPSPEPTLAEYEQAVQQSPKSGIAHYNLGVALLDSSQPKRAMTAFQTALQYQPDLMEAYYNLGVAHLELEQWSAATLSFQAALALQPGFFDAWINLGTALVGQGLLAEAISSYQRALELQPTSITAYRNLSHAYQESGQRQVALNCTQMANALRAVELKPDWPEAQVNLGQIYQQQGNRAAAIACYERALSLQPDFEPAQVQLAQLLPAASGLAACSDQLRPFNLIAFPDWQQPVAELYDNLTAILWTILTHPQRSHLALLLETSHLPPQLDLAAVLEEITLHLLLTTGLELDEVPEILPVSHLSASEWEVLSARVQGRISLPQEDRAAIERLGGDCLPAVELAPAPSEL